VTELNIAALVIGYAILALIFLGIAVIVVLGLWHWLTEQIWLAGRRVERRELRKRQAKEPTQ
jgi:hypothetical protein